MDMAGIKSKIFIEIGDITKSECDAIVNAANRSLLGGGAWTERFIEPQGRDCLKNAGSLEDVKQGRLRLPEDTG